MTPHLLIILAAAEDSFLSVTVSKQLREQHDRMHMFFSISAMTVHVKQPYHCGFLLLRVECNQANIMQIGMPMWWWFECDFSVIRSLYVACRDGNKLRSQVPKRWYYLFVCSDGYATEMDVHWEKKVVGCKWRPRVLYCWPRKQHRWMGRRSGRLDSVGGNFFSVRMTIVVAGCTYHFVSFYTWWERNLSFVGWGSCVVYGERCLVALNPRCEKMYKLPWINWTSLGCASLCRGQKWRLEDRLLDSTQLL